VLKGALRYVDPSLVSPVPPYYKTIAAAVSGASPGDTIYLKADRIFTGVGNKNITITKNLTFDKYGDGANPIIDMQNSGRLFVIDSGITVAISNFNIQNGNAGDGGAIYNNGSLEISNCSFSGNSASHGGAIYNNRGSLEISNCSFSGNTAVYSGGAILNENSSSLISCSRFFANSARYGSAINNSAGTVTAINNWWGTNAPDAGVLFYGDVTYDPWIRVSLAIDPATVAPGELTTIKATFSSDCIPNGIPVAFSVTDGTVTPTESVTLDGVATTTLHASYNGLAFTITATVGPNAENYSLSLTSTPDPILPGISLVKLIESNSTSSCWPGVVVPLGSTMNISYLVTNTGNVTLANINVTDDQGYVITQSTSTLLPSEESTSTASGAAPAMSQLHKNVAMVTASKVGSGSVDVSATVTAYATSIPTDFYRFNWGCVCSDTGTSHFLIGSRNNPLLNANSLYGYIFDATSTPSLHTGTPLDFGTHVIMNSAVYNTAGIMNIAVLTQSPGDSSSITLVTVLDTDYTFSVKSTTSLATNAFKLQWFVAPSGHPYIVTDGEDTINLYSVDLATYEITLTSSTSNLASGVPSTYLYWLPQGDKIYVVQGYGNASVATYKVDFPAISAGVATDLSSTFSVVNACSTGSSYLVLGGSYNSVKGLLKEYSVDESGLVDDTLSTTFDTIIYYCERCSCGSDSLLVGTDNGLYSLNPTDFTITASNISMMNNQWLNVCWCCDNPVVYSAARNSSAKTFIFKQEGSALTPVWEL
jgi:predicted outer membrane repeat protein